MEIYCCRRPFESLATTAFRLLHRLLHDVMKKIIKGGDGYEAPLNGDQVEVGLPKLHTLPTDEPIEEFLFKRCKNVNCKQLLTVEDCDCKICSTKKGLCCECMCHVCLNFDFASQTYSWIGCDVCSHQCHAICSAQKNIIKPRQSLKGPAGTIEMEFNRLCCGHASEMFGFIKDVFKSCAEQWCMETLIKELE